MFRAYHWFMRTLMHWSANRIGFKHEVLFVSEYGFGLKDGEILCVALIKYEVDVPAIISKSPNVKRVA